MSDPLQLAVERYLAELRDIRAMGGAVAEISYYSAIRELLDAVGKHLKPRVRAFMQLRNTGAGNPDGGLYTLNQWKLVEGSPDPLSGQIPARGAIEVKGSSEDAFTAASEQVARYAERYGLVLVTNLRDFALVRWEDGGARVLETCSLAPDERTFLGNICHPQTFAAAAGEGLTEFLKRVMLQNAPLSDPKDLAWFLASYAHTARLRLEHKRELPALDQLRSQLEEALGLKFEGEKGDHFFRSTLVQTLFYGVFAAWVLAEEEHIAGTFEWRRAADTLEVPFISVLFWQFANPAQLAPLGIAEVLDWTEDALNRVDRAAFFERFKKEHAVQYFYEPFLEAFDPELRRELGVWYTPDEVVRYMVARVDWALREELGIADGLADESVYVLDPCCGTGAYLVEVLRTIDKTLQAKGADALTRQDVKRAAMKRVIGFEIMPAPFVITHLQLGLLLAELGVPLSHGYGEHERAAVYLTNALTGWGTEDPNAPGVPHKKAGAGQLLFEFEEERDAAAMVKREAPILVVIGNPPYNGFAGVAEDEEAGVLEPFKRNRQAWGVSKNKLDDLYLRFFALALKSVGANSKRGVVAFISNDSWVAGPSYVTVRDALLSEFDEFWIEGMHGDRTMSEYGPDGRTSQTVFAISGFSPGIRQGVAISTWLKRGTRRGSPEVRYRDDLNDSDAVDRRHHLLASINDPDWHSHYKAASPTTDNRLSFRPFEVAAGYMGWPSVQDISAVAPMLGLNENRGEALIDLDPQLLAERIATYLNPVVSFAALPSELRGLTRDWARFDAVQARERLLQATSFDHDRVHRFLVKPLDEKYAYLDSSRPLWNEPRPELQRQVTDDAEFILARVRAPKMRDGMSLGYARGACDQHALHKDAYLIPIALQPAEGRGSLFAADTESPRPNLSSRALQYLRDVGLPEGINESRKVWMHVLAIGFSSEYLAENAAGVALDWPRIPLPSSTQQLDSSATLSARIAKLLDPRSDCSRCLSARVAAVLTGADAHVLRPDQLGVRAQWGICQREGVITGGPGKLTERDYTASERAAIAEAAGPLGMSADAAIQLLGTTCFDVWLNDVAYWRCVPANVWRYTIGGYQVIKKWLSYRETSILGRDLKPEEAAPATRSSRPTPPPRSCGTPSPSTGSAATCSASVPRPERGSGTSE